MGIATVDRACAASPRATPHRLRLTIRGAVQGVGFRPFVYRLATEMNLAGWVNNNSSGVTIEVEGPAHLLEQFRHRVEEERPSISVIDSLEMTILDPAGYSAFEIQSSESGAKSVTVLPDLATCPECRAEIFDAENRRFQYPFTNCTNCGPRFSIIEAIPYDRPNTSMKQFVMCEACLAEYRDPTNRRFHAQPNACPECGPHLELWSTEGEVLSTDEEALDVAVAALRVGLIVAMKGLGGFHLLVNASNEKAVQKLRERKGREEKPLAIMAPDIEFIRSMCEVSSAEEQLLLSPQSPIVLLRRLRQPEHTVAPSVAPNNPYLGVMLPYTPLHHLVLADFRQPLVATSGNRSDEPICTDSNEALERLRDIADVFLVHDRPIVRHVDDSVARVVLGEPVLVRRARGYAPLPVTLAEAPGSLLAVGAHQKNTIATAVDRQVFISQHIGDLDTVQSSAAFTAVIDSFEKLYEQSPAMTACDMHPDYASTQWAQGAGKPTVEVQHHHAHILSCMAEHHLQGPVLGVAWDGSGYGPDGTVWGGEFLRIDERGAYQRFAHFRQFRLAGGERAVREPRRVALALLLDSYGADLIHHPDLAPLAAFTPGELEVLTAMLSGGTNSPLTSSAGRLFDGISSLAGIRQRTSFEGQAAMELEFSIDQGGNESPYPFAIDRKAAVEIDWRMIVRAVVGDLRREVPPGRIARRFHETLVETILGVCQLTEEKTVVLSGGCFQNHFLLERTIDRLRSAGFTPYWHRRVPTNDGGIALGQIVAAGHSLRDRSEKTTDTNSRGRS